MAGMRAPFGALGRWRNGSFPMVRAMGCAGGGAEFEQGPGAGCRAIRRPKTIQADAAKAGGGNKSPPGGEVWFACHS